MSKLKRTVTEQSPDIESNKKLNCNTTPTKSQELLLPIMETNSSETESQARAAALDRINEVKAPVLFKEAFSFICNDLADIRSNLTRIEKCENICEKKHFRYQ